MKNSQGHTGPVMRRLGKLAIVHEVMFQVAKCDWVVGGDKSGVGHEGGNSKVMRTMLQVCTSTYIPVVPLQDDKELQEFNNWKVCNLHLFSITIHTHMALLYQ